MIKNNVLKHYILHLYAIFLCVEVPCNDKLPGHRRSNSTLSPLRGTSISPQCLQSGHKTATTLWMCAEFLLSSPPKKPHPSLYSSLLAFSLTHHTPRTSAHTYVIFHLSEHDVPASTGGYIQPFYSVTKLVLNTIEFEVWGHRTTNSFHIKGYWSFLGDRCKSGHGGPLQPLRR